MVELLLRFDSSRKPGDHTHSKTKTPTTRSCDPAPELTPTTHLRANSPDLRDAEPRRIRRISPFGTNTFDALGPPSKYRVVVLIARCCVRLRAYSVHLHAALAVLLFSTRAVSQHTAAAPTVFHYLIATTLLFLRLSHLHFTPTFWIQTAQFIPDFYHYKLHTW